MPSTPAMTTGMMFLMTRPGFITPMDAIPTPDFAVPYAAPMSASRMGSSETSWCESGAKTRQNQHTTTPHRNEFFPRPSQGGGKPRKESKGRGGTTSQRHCTYENTQRHGKCNAPRIFGVTLTGEAQGSRHAHEAEEGRRRRAGLVRNGGHFFYRCCCDERSC